jgi:hypothetical protein
MLAYSVTQLAREIGLRTASGGKLGLALPKDRWHCASQSKDEKHRASTPIPPHQSSCEDCIGLFFVVTAQSKNTIHRSPGFRVMAIAPIPIRE